MAMAAELEVEAAEVTSEHMTWRQELESLVNYNLTGPETAASMSFDDTSGIQPPGSFGESVKEFGRGLGEMTIELARSFSDVAKQSLGDERSFVVRKFGKPLNKVSGKLEFLNEYLPEDKDPIHSWTVILSVLFVALTVLSFTRTTRPVESIPLPVVKDVYIHPPGADRILLPDGRHLAYHEQGVPASVARFSIFVPHPFLSSRLAGIPGLKDSLMEEFGIRLITYDLPGFGESDPHPHRTIESSAQDILLLADSLQVHDKFWLMGYSSGSMHVWAALRYIPDRLAGAALFAPMVNPYDPGMTKEERSGIWEKWTPKRKLTYILARRFPGLLRFFYHRSFFSGKHAPADKWLSLSLGKKDRALIEEPEFEEFWQRNVEESIRQGTVKPFVEEAVLQVSNWGFKIADLQSWKKRRGGNFLFWLKSIYSQGEEELMGFLGPIHIWQGMDDRVVPPATTTFIHRNLPGATVHILPNDGHFTYLYFCDECHRQVLTTIFGTPQGPLQNATEEWTKTNQVEEEEEKLAGVGDSNQVEEASLY